MIYRHVATLYIHVRASTESNISRLGRLSARQPRLCGHTKSEAELVVTRNSALYPVGLNVKFYIDGTLAAEFGQAEVRWFGLKQGAHIFAINDDGASFE